MKNKELNNKSKTLLIVISTITVLIIVGIIVILLNPFKRNNFSEKDFPLMSLDTNQGEYREADRPYQRNIVMPGWVEFDIAADTTDITYGIDFFNPKDNLWYECPKCHNPLDENYKCINEKCNEQYTKDNAKTNCYYLSFALYLSNNDECLYQSNLVEPDMHLQHITLSRPLDKGTYDAYVFIQPYMSDMKTPCNNGKVYIKLNVN